MKAVLNILTLIIIAVLITSILLRGRETATVINSITGFFSNAFAAILGQVRPAAPAGGGAGAAAPRRRQGR